MKKTCLYCDKEFNQSPDFEECLDCKFPVKGTADEAIKYAHSMYLKSQKVFYVFLGLGLVAIFFLLSKYYEYLGFVNAEEFGGILGIITFENKSTLNMLISDLVPFVPWTVVIIIASLIGGYIHLLSILAKSKQKLSKND